MSQEGFIAWHGKARHYKGQAPPDKKRKLLVAEIHKEDQDISTKALEVLWKLQHFNEYPIFKTSFESCS